MHAEVIDIDFNTCAPGIRKSERLGPAYKLSAGRFKKHRITLKVAWQLRDNRDQDVILETVTEGRFSGWNRSVASTDAIEEVLEGVVLQLFADSSFINKILVEEDQSGLDAVEFPTQKPITT